MCLGIELNPEMMSFKKISLLKLSLALIPELECYLSLAKRIPENCQRALGGKKFR